MKMANTRVDAAAFIDAWVLTFEEGGNQSDVARKIGTTAANVSTRAKKLREAGVELPELTTTRGVKLDIAALNERLAARLNHS
jgi:DNA-binding transcriptional regulator LsrR (DeoR family)